MPYTRYLCRKPPMHIFNGYRYIRLKAPVTVRNIKRNATLLPRPPSPTLIIKRTHQGKEKKKDVVRDESIV